MLVKSGKILGRLNVSSKWCWIGLVLVPSPNFKRQLVVQSRLRRVWNLKYTEVTWRKDLVEKQYDGDFELAHMTKLFSTKLLLNKIWNTTVSLFSCLNEFQTVCRVWELPKQRGGDDCAPPASVLSHIGLSWHNSFSSHAESLQAIHCFLRRGIDWQREGQASIV